jgi:3-(3-hydroxy-phenyl)propionate hydroxylase
MDADDMFDVAVIGLGPVGAVLAGLLGQAGIRTLAIDKLPDIYPLPRAIGLDHEIMRVMQGLGLAEAIQPFVTPYRPTEYHGLNGKVIARYASLPPPFPQGWEPGYMFDQPQFERALRRRLKELPTVDVRLETSLESFEANDSFVEMTLVGKTREKVSARYVVGCDGASSLVRKTLGVQFDSLDFDEPWLVVDVLVEPHALPRLPETIIQFCNPERPASYIVGPGPHRRWEIMLQPDERPEDMTRDEAIWPLLSRWLKPGDAKLWRSACYVFHALVAGEWRKGRVFLAGDAAHMTPPFMAQGMCQGIRDAANLAWKLDLALKGAAGGALLDSYEQERKPHVLATTEKAKELGRVICERDAVRARERDRRLLAERGDPPQVAYRQDLIPPLKLGALAAGRPGIGSRFPQPRIKTDQGDLLLDDFVSNGFRLFLADADAVTSIAADLRRSLTRLGAGVVCLTPNDRVSTQHADSSCLVETGTLLRDWFALHGVVAALVRPDHYVMATFATPEQIWIANNLVAELLDLVRAWPEEAKGI